jgi:acyl-coenzyme A thioesterase PaaI-like protein
LRPGGTISGPSMFTLADVALYVAIVAALGTVGHAVTTHLTINFLHRPPPRDLIGEARLFKLGKRLAVGEVAIFSVGDPEMVAHATGAYSIPPRRAAHEVSRYLIKKLELFPMIPENGVDKSARTPVYAAP